MVEGNEMFARKKGIRNQIVSRLQTDILCRWLDTDVVAGDAGYSSTINVDKKTRPLFEHIGGDATALESAGRDGNQKRSRGETTSGQRST